MEICISLNVKQYPCLHGVLSICIRGNSLSILSLIRQKQQGGKNYVELPQREFWQDWAVKENPRGFCGMNGWTGDSSAGCCGVAEASWGKIENTAPSVGQQLQGKLPVKLNRKSQYISHNVFFGRFLSKHMRNYHLLWCGDDSLFREALIINLTKLHFSPSSFCFLHVSVAQFVSSVMKSTRGQPQRQNTGRCKNNSSWFNLCKGKHYFLVICFLQLLPQTDATA